MKNHVITYFNIHEKISRCLSSKNARVSRNQGKITPTIKHDVYGKRQTIDSRVSQKRENLRFSTFLILLRSYSIYTVNRQVSPCFGEKEISSYRFSFAVNVMLNLSNCAI